jgi:hypothetical protein
MWQMRRTGNRNSKGNLKKGFGVLDISGLLLRATPHPRPVHGGGRVFPEPVGKHDAQTPCLLAAADDRSALAMLRRRLSLALGRTRSPILAFSWRQSIGLRCEPNTGSTCEQRTRLKAPSRPCGTGQSVRKAAFQTRPRLRWCLNWSRAPRKAGVGSTDTTSCQS